MKKLEMVEMIERNAGHFTQRQDRRKTRDSLPPSLSCYYCVRGSAAFKDLCGIGKMGGAQFCLKMQASYSASEQPKKSSLLDLRGGRNTESDEAPF